MANLIGLDKRKAGAFYLLIPLLGAFGLAHYSRMSKVESPAKYVYAPQSPKPIEFGLR